jgi:hypothetical protein
LATDRKCSPILHFERIPINRTNGRVIVWVIGRSEPDGFARRGAKFVFRENPERVVQDSTVGLVRRHHKATNGRAQNLIACQTVEIE